MKQTSTSNLNNMTHITENNSATFKSLIWITLLLHLFACYLSFYKKAVYADLLINYLWIPAAVIVVIGLCRKIYFQRRINIFYFAFLCWMIITYWLKDDLLISDPTNRTFLISRGIICLIALPFAQIMNDTGKRRHIDTFLTIMVCITAILLWFSYIGALRGESFNFFDGRFMFGATYTYTDRMMLQFFNLYYYKTGYLALVCFFTTLYLAVSHWSIKRSVPYALLMITFTIAVVITYSRTAVFTFLIGLIIALLILLQHLQIRPAIRRAIIGFSSIAGIIIAAVGLNYTYKFFNSIRDIWYGIDTLSSRTDIWSSITELIHERPCSMIYGLPVNESMQIMNGYIDLADKVSNMHSGYLQTLVLTGLPGLVAVLLFCSYLIVAAARILFSKTSNTAYPSSVKLMVIVPVCCMIMNLIESLIFFNPVQTDILNLITALFSGYIIEYAYHQKQTKALN